MYERHPDFGPHLVWRWLDVGIADMRALDAVPNEFVGGSPAAKAFNAFGYELQFPGNVSMVMDGRINVERRDVATLHVFGIVLGMIAPHATANVVVPRHSLPEIQEDRTRGIRCANPRI